MPDIEGLEERRVSVEHGAVRRIRGERVDGPTGRYLHTNEMRQTSVPGVFAGGDVSLAAGSVALAVAEGVRAGAGAHFSLIDG